MKSLTLSYPDKKYDWIFSLFIQRSLIMMFLKDILTSDNLLEVNFEVDAWRYVFEKDISKSKLIKNMSKNGVNNLVALEVVNKLNSIRKIVDEVYKKEKVN